MKDRLLPGDQIFSSTNYNQFVLHAFNRDIDKKQLAAIMEDMKKNGFRSSEPLDVAETEAGMLEIRKGHHRFVAAKTLNIPLKYVLSNIRYTPGDIEPKEWKINDALIGGCRAGNPNYLKVREYMALTGIGINNAISMLGGHSAGSGNFREVFRKFKYKVADDISHAEKVGSIVMALKKIGLKWANNSLFVNAISKVAWVEDFDANHFIRKVKGNISRMEQRHNVESYIDLISTIYNIRTREKIDLKFLAETAAKRRNVCFNLQE